MRIGQKLICTYCVSETNAGHASRDHVIATFWYPDTTPPDVQRWTVPSCRRCNNVFGRLEQELLVRFALCIEPSVPATSGIIERALRAIDPNLATTQEDKKRRKALRRWVLRDVSPVEELPQKGLLPYFNNNWDLGSRVVVHLNSRVLHKVVRKWVKGTHFVLTRRLIKSWSDIDVFHVTPETEHLAFHPIEPFLESHDKGPGIVVARAQAADEAQFETIYRFVIWNQYRVHGALSERDVLGV